MLIPHGTVIALVDARGFRLMRNGGTEAEPALSETPAPRLDAHNHSGAGHHHGGAAELTEEAHAIAAADWLAGEVQGKRIENLILVAPPRTLGEIRRHAGKKLERALLTEVPKDLTARRVDEVLTALRGR